ncbi:multidrug effflux MFS transporter [uncultured Clostridium sp.]|uniref:multidrug effflux MFS transporter n=1 Tax=uncultured Clostridium sp. TaxID=59620 RepID=UPI002601D193|nr:multidrug effflux MFS transporter [uncultured Clostridium sp.]
METEEKINQKYLKKKWFIAFIGFLSAFVPMSTDLYLPALPDMVKTFHTNVAFLNLTITLFFVFYAVGMLIWGPLSDKHGRKNILLVGMGFYLVGSILCAFAVNVPMLIGFRIIQAIGSGAAVSVATAMMKDVYTGKKLVAMLATVQSIAMTSPVISPFVGSLILKYTSWRGIFVILTIVSIIAFIGGMLLTETLEVKSTGNVIEVFSKLHVVLKNPAFTLLMFVFALISLPLMAYITMSSYIYITGFGLSEEHYSYFFAIGGIFLVMGPMLYIKLAKKFKPNNIIIALFIIVIISGVCVALFGEKSPVILIVTIVPALMFGNMLRPPGTHICLAQQDDNIGSASSLVSFTNTMIGSIGMIIITLNFGSKILNIGIMYILVGILGLILWLIFHKKSFIRQAK